MRINWKIFEGNSHCKEGVCLFGRGQLSSNQWLDWHLPYMKEQAAHVRQITIHIPLITARKRARRAARRKGWMTPGDCV